MSGGEKLEVKGWAEIQECGINADKCLCITQVITG